MCFVFFVMCCIIFHFIDGITCVYLEYMEYSCIFSNVLRCCFFCIFLVMVYIMFNFIEA